MTPQVLDELFAEAGVDIGAPEKRAARAARCFNEGMVAADLEELVAWAHETRRKLHTVGHWVGWATSRGDRWRAVLKDLRQLKEARKRRQPTPNQPAPAPRATEDTMHRTIAMAYLRVRADRAPVDVVANELGVDVPQVLAWIEEEERRRSVPPPAPGKPLKLPTVSATHEPHNDQESETW